VFLFKNNWRWLFCFCLGFLSAANVAADDNGRPTDNPPTASSVTFSGTLQAGEVLTSSYSYADVDSDAETTSTYKWYASDDAAGTDKSQIAITENVS